jgi:hypothetical protein
MYMVLSLESMLLPTSFFIAFSHVAFLNLVYLLSPFS